MYFRIEGVFTMNENKKNVLIQKKDGMISEVELVTYLVSDDKLKRYLVYSKGEKDSTQGDEVIYVSKIIREGNVLTLEEIVDDEEWIYVQNLLKKIANA